MLNHVVKTLIKLAVLTVTVSSFAACAKKNGGSNVAPDNRKQTAPTGTDGGGNFDSIEPVVVLDPDGTESQVPSPSSRQEDRTEEQSDRNTEVRSSELKRLLAEGSKNSATSDDALREFLLYKLNSTVPSEDQQLKNIKAAQDVQNASLKITGTSVEMRLTAKIGNTNKEVLFTGYKSNARTAQLGAVIDNRPVSATLECKDADIRSCETSFARIELGVKPHRRYVYIIFKKTNVSIQADFSERKCVTRDCQDLFNVFVTSSLTNEALHNVEYGAGKISSATLETFEVLNGKTGMKLNMITLGKEIMSINAALLKNSVTRASTQVDFRDQNGTGLKTNLNAKMNEVHIVGNNNRGGITASIVTRDSRNSDKFHLTVNRVSKPLEILMGDLK